MFISGRVQGVFFRQTALEKASKLGVLGWVRNLPDGRVEAVFEGEKDIVNKMVSWAKKGPVSARVENCEVDFQPFKGEFKGFNIKL